MLVLHTPGEVETPNRYRNRYGQLLESAPFSHRDMHPPADLVTHREGGEYEVIARVRGGLQRYMLDYHPLDVVGWDGYVYPYTFNVHDFEPRTGRFHLPPPVHQTFQGPNFVVCSFCPRELDYDPQAIALPYHHSNLQSEEIIYYVSGDFGSRKGIEVGSVTVHPSGLPHGPQPGLVEKSLGARRTEELAVMWDTFGPLKLTTFAARPRRARATPTRGGRASRRPWRRARPDSAALIRVALRRGRAAPTRGRGNSNWVRPGPAPRPARVPGGPRPGRRGRAGSPRRRPRGRRARRLPAAAAPDPDRVSSSRQPWVPGSEPEIVPEA